jgi:hypothetical protein
LFLAFFEDEFRDLEFTGDPGLTEAASFNRYPVFLVFVPSDNSITVFGTSVLIVTFCRDGPGWTSGGAGSAGFVEIIKAIGPAMGIDLLVVALRG